MSAKSTANCWNKSLGKVFPRAKATVEEDAMGSNEEEIRIAEQHIGANLTVQDWVNSWEAAEESITWTEILADTQIVQQIKQEPVEDDTEDI